MRVCVAMQKGHTTRDSRAHGLWLERRFYCKRKLSGLQEGATQGAHLLRGKEYPVTTGIWRERGNASLFLWWVPVKDWLREGLGLRVTPKDRGRRG